MKGRYYIDCWDIEGIDSDMEASEETVKETLQELLNTTENDIEKLLQIFEESEHSENMSIHKWDFDNVEVWD